MTEYTEVSEIWIWTVWDDTDDTGPADSTESAAGDTATSPPLEAAPRASESTTEAAPSAGAEPAADAPPAIAGFAVEASDGHIGTVDEVSYDAGTGAVVVDTGHWIFGKKRMVPAGMISAIDHEKRVVTLSCSKADVKAAPDHDAARADDASHRDEVGEHYEKTTASTP